MAEEISEMLRRRESIEAKMLARDYIAARLSILEASKLFPCFDQASEMITVCDILSSAEMELPDSGIDWYWVLQLFPSVSPTGIEAQYQKIISQLSPVRNDFPGAELALKLAAEAFSVLSDPIKRATFDSKRNAFQSTCEDSCSPSSSRLKRAADEACSASEDLDEKKMKICDVEASWVTENANLDDDDNLRMDVARERPEKGFFDFESSRKAELFSVGQIWAAYDREHMPRRYARIEKILDEKCQFYIAWLKARPNQVYENQLCDAGLLVPCGTFGLVLNSITLCGLSLFSHLLLDGEVKEPFEIYPKKGDVWAIYRDWDISWCADLEMRKKCAFEIVEVLSDYMNDLGAKVAYMVRVDGLKNVFARYTKGGKELSFQIPGNKLLMFSHKVPLYRFKGGEIDGISNGMLELDPFALPDNLVQDFSCTPLNSISRSYEEKDCSNEASASNIITPSTNSANFEGSTSGVQKRKSKLSAKDFARDQVWAIYDGPGSMPRTYVKINCVVSSMEVSITYLDPHPMLDQEIHWVEENLPLGCGVFRASRDKGNMEISKFSHLVQCDSSRKKTFYRVFPRKGEIWAMYNNWSINWKNSDFNNCSCRVVEILSDFSEENGVTICSLVEVPGFLTFFQKKVLEDGFQITRQLSRKELLSFSHRVPAFAVTGIKNNQIPKGSLHLEPDALPPRMS